MVIQRALLLHTSTIYRNTLLSRLYPSTQQQLTYYLNTTRQVATTMKQSSLGTFFGGKKGKKEDSQDDKVSRIPEVGLTKMKVSTNTPLSSSNSNKNKRVIESSDEEEKEETGAAITSPFPVQSESMVGKKHTRSPSSSASSSCTQLDESAEEEEKVVKEKKKVRATAKPKSKKAKIATTHRSTADEDLELIDTKDGKQVPYLELCKVFEAINGTTKRLEITALIRDFLVKVMRVDQEQLTHTVMLCITKIAPDHEGIELGIGESILIKSIAAATGKQVARVKQDRQQLGDLGMVVQRGKSTQNAMFKPKPLSVSKVFATFKEIALTSGSSSIQKKQRLITGLLAACSTTESKYIIRSLENRLRIGLAESTVQTALAHAAVIYEEKTSPDVISSDEYQRATESLKQVLSEYPIYSHVVDSIYKYGIGDVVNHCTLTPTLPVKPMLAKIEKAADDILKRFEDKPFTCEFKYDGERSQVHYVRENDGQTKCVIFSRNAENNTAKYPDIASSVAEVSCANFFICICIGWLIFSCSLIVSIFFACSFARKTSHRLFSIVRRWPGIRKVAKFGPSKHSVRVKERWTMRRISLLVSVALYSISCI